MASVRLAVGDILHLNDWQLHIIRIEHDKAVAVLTAEFGFLIHFAQDHFVTVQALRQRVTNTRQSLAHTDGRVTPLTLDVTSAAQIHAGADEVGSRCPH
jgi:hypothetical protein